MSIPLRSNQTTQGRLRAGARALWRANGMKAHHFGRPVFAIANSFTQLVPGHVHLHDVGQYVKSEIEKAGCFAAEFNTIAIDDGIAMGHDGMRYSLPSRELIADSIEYMCNAHKVDALVCIPNCDKIVPGMLMGAMRLNIPTVFVSGGPMEAGRVEGKAYDFIDALVMAGDKTVPDAFIDKLERAACPTCGCCSGMFTANSMNCLTEALGLALPGHGTVVATHTRRKQLFTDAARLIVRLTRRYYDEGDTGVLPRSIATRAAFMNAMALDIAMGGSTNTVLHLLAVARSGEVSFDLSDIDRLSRQVPCICKVSPNADYHIEDVNRAGGIMGILGELDRAGLIDTGVKRIDAPTLGECLEHYDIMRPSAGRSALETTLAAPGGKPNFVLGSQDAAFPDPDLDREAGCIRDMDHAYYPDGGLAVLSGNMAENGCIVKTAGVDPGMLTFRGRARVFDSQESACQGILDGEIRPGDVVVVRYEGPRGGPGMQEMLYPTSYLKSMQLDKSCALITDGRFSGGSSGLSIGHISPEAAAGGTIALIRDNDEIEISIPDRAIRLRVPDAALSERRKKEESKGDNAFKPLRNRPIPEALRVYAHFTSSADTGGVRCLPEAEG